MKTQERNSSSQRRWRAESYWTSGLREACRNSNLMPSAPRPLTTSHYTHGLTIRC